MPQSLQKETVDNSSEPQREAGDPLPERDTGEEAVLSSNGLLQTERTERKEGTPVLAFKVLLTGASGHLQGRVFENILKLDPVAAANVMLAGETTTFWILKGFLVLVAVVSCGMFAMLVHCLSGVVKHYWTSRVTYEDEQDSFQQQFPEYVRLQISDDSRKFAGEMGRAYHIQQQKGDSVYLARF